MEVNMLNPIAFAPESTFNAAEAECACGSHTGGGFGKCQCGWHTGDGDRDKEA